MKRKRHSSGPSERQRPDDEPLHSSSKNASGNKQDLPFGANLLRRTLKDKADCAHIEVVGRLNTTHRFRSKAGPAPYGVLVLTHITDLPDYHFVMSGQPFMQRLRDQILPMNCMLATQAESQS
jgi:hypothetical protein